MRFDELRLDNIRSYDDELITFPQGSLLLVGDIGCGKSTILQAIEFALFGIQRGLQDASHLLRNSANEGSVTLSCTIQNQKVVINRGLKRSKTSIAQTAGYLLVDGKKEELAATELRARMLELLGYPSDVTSKANSMIFRYTVYASQEQMKHIITERPESRLDTLRVIFGIDNYKHAIANSQTVIRVLKKRSTFLQGSFADVMQKKEALIVLDEELTTKLAAKDSQIKTVESDTQALGAIKKEFEVISEKYDSQKRVLEKINILKQTKVTIEKTISDFSTVTLSEEITTFEQAASALTLESVKDIISIEKNLFEKKQLFDRNTALKNSFSSEIKALDARIADIAARTSALDYESLTAKTTLLANLTKKLSTLKEKQTLCVAAKATLISKEARITELRTSFESISSLTSCPTCKQEVSKEHSAACMAETNAFIDALNKEIICLKTTIAEFDLTSFDALSKEHDVLTKEIAVLQSRSESIAKDSLLLTEFLEKKSLYEKKLEIVSQFDFESEKAAIVNIEQDLINQRKLQLQHEQKKSLLATLESKKSLLRERLVAHEQTLLKGKDLSEDLLILNKQIDASIEITFNQLKAQLAIAQQKYTVTFGLLESLSASCTQLQKQKTALLEDIAGKDEAQKHASYCDFLKNWLNDFFIPLMKNIEQHVLTHVHQEFSAHFTHWFNVLLEDDAFLATVDEQFTPRIQQQGYDISIEALSGGERTSVALAYRLALHRVVNTLLLGLQTSDILILDEPTEGFSTEQLDKVRDVLQELSVEQLMLVSHEQIDGFVEHVLTIVKEGTSKVRV